MSTNEQVKTPRNGRPGGHVAKVKDAQKGLENDIEVLKNKIKWARKYAKPEPKEAVARAERQLEEMRNILETSKRRVP